MDFGISGLTTFVDRSKAGTIRYMAPEVLTEEDTSATPAVDVFSMGCILFSLVMGRIPFDAKEKDQVKQDIKQGDYSYGDSKSGS